MFKKIKNEIETAWALRDIIVYPLIAGAITYGTVYAIQSLIQTIIKSRNS